MSSIDNIVYNNLPTSESNIKAKLKLNAVARIKTGGGGGTMDHSELDNLEYETCGHTGFAGIKYKTTAEWEAQMTYVPPSGMLVVYTDYEQLLSGKMVMGIKIGDGNTLVNNLPFITDALDEKVMQHVAVLDEDIVTTITVGGIPEGSVLTKGTTWQSIFKMILAPEQPAPVGKLYWSTLDSVPESITEEFIEEEIPADFINNGAIHYFTTVGKQYECFAYPKEYGEIRHIYENNMTMFDLIDSFASLIVLKDGMEYYLYVAIDPAKESNAKYQFLLK